MGGMTTPSLDIVKPRIDRGLDDIYVKETTICLVDGEKGRLLYRGYDIRDLAKHSTFEETVFILIHGRLPRREELDELRADLAAARPITKEMVRLLKEMPKDAPPIDVLRTAISYLSNFDAERDDASRDANMRKTQRLIAAGRYYHLRSNLPELAKHVLEDARKEFAEQVRTGDFVVGGRNFGKGSSREHAPLIIKIAGTRAVLAKSFARIFYRNCINIGLPAVVVDTD